MDKGRTMILCNDSERYMKLLNNISLSNDTIKLTKNEQKILNLIIENNQITREEIVSKTRLSDRTVSRAIKNLQNNNLILREGSKKLESWKIL